MQHFIKKHLPFCFVAMASAVSIKDSPEEAAGDFMIGFVGNFLGDEYVDAMVSCASEIGEDVINFADAVEECEENGAKPENVIDMMKLILNWPRTLKNCVEQVSTGEKLKFR